MAIIMQYIYWIARQIQSDFAAWPQYGARDQTRREHFQALRAYLGLSAFGLADFRRLAHSLADLAMQTDKGLVLAAHAMLSSGVELAIPLHLIRGIEAASTADLAPAATASTSH